jgi:hypothetical protein
MTIRYHFLGGILSFPREMHYLDTRSFPSVGFLSCTLHILSEHHDSNENSSGTVLVFCIYQCNSYTIPSSLLSILQMKKMIQVLE